jgi:preprotein translocase subunit SecD
MLRAAATRPLEQAAVRTMRLKIIPAALVATAATAAGYGILTRGGMPLLAAVRFELRLAEEQPSPGLIVAPVAGSNRLVYLHPEIVAGNEDIAQSAVTQQGPSQFAVAVDFLPAAVPRVREATAAHIGRPIAILIDGHVVMTPTVRSPIAEAALITGTFSEAEASRIANGILVP